MNSDKNPGSITESERTTITCHLSKDPVLHTVMQQTPFPVRHASDDPYLYLLEAIVNQQLSFKVATIIYRRFTGLFEAAYPDPRKVLELPEASLRGIGLSRQKIAYIRNTATFALEQGLEYDMLKQLDDEEIIRLLTTIKGVGRWTAEMVLMFPMHRPDVFPVDDLGIQKTMQSLYAVSAEGRGLKKALTEVAAAWQPYRTWACKYLWDFSD